MQKGCCHSAAAAPFHNGHRNGHLVGMTGAKEPKNFNQSLMAMNESTGTGTNITWPVILFFPFSFSRLLCRHLTNSLDCTVVVLTLFFFPSHTHTHTLISYFHSDYVLEHHQCTHRHRHRVSLSLVSERTLWSKLSHVAA